MEYIYYTVLLFFYFLYPSSIYTNLQDVYVTLGTYFIFSCYLLVFVD